MTGLYQASGSAVSLAVYVVPCVRFTRFVRLFCLLSRCNTRYGWLVRPYPMGTFTPQETPSFAWRTNAGRQARLAAGARDERTLEAVACTPCCDTKSQGWLSGMKYGPDLLFHQQYPTRYGSKVTRCQKPSDKGPTVTRLAPEPRGNGVSASIRRRWDWMDGMVNTGELSINVVNRNKPKMLRGLSQKAL